MSARLTTQSWCRAIVLGVLVTGCGSDPAAPASLPLPVIEATTVAPNPRSVLSAVVRMRVHGAVSVAVRYRLVATAGGDSLTPAVPVSDGTTELPVLGLLPGARYALRVVAVGAGGTTLGEPVELTTAELPSDVPRFSTVGSSPTPGYVVFAAGLYGLVIDNTGRVVWYHRFANGLGLSFAAQPVGRYVARLVTPDPSDVEPWVELDPLGNTTRMIGCALGLQPRFHDLLVEPDGAYWIMCDEVRTLDLTAAGGVANARVIGTAVHHISASGALLLQWSPFDHFATTDVGPVTPADTLVNWTHGNALDIDTDGNLLVSFRNLNEITKIDAATGRVIWRLGGRRNQFTFLDTPMPAFSQQHSIRAGGSGSLLLLDNVGNPNESGAERYVLDERAMTARLVRSYVSLPRVVTQIGGSTQPLPGGHTLVSFGTAGRVEEYDAVGSVVWRIEGNAGYVFRAQRIPSLYTPGVGAAR
jgi:hypothetical protein